MIQGDTPFELYQLAVECLNSIGIARHSINQVIKYKDTDYAFGADIHTQSVKENLIQMINRLDCQITEAINEGDAKLKCGLSPAEAYALDQYLESGFDEYR